MAFQDRHLDDLVVLVTEVIHKRFGIKHHSFPPKKNDSHTESNDLAPLSSTRFSLLTRANKRPLCSPSSVPPRRMYRAGTLAGVPSDVVEIAKLIDHTLLRADARREEIIRLCDEAKTHNFASVCVHTTWAALANQQLAGSNVMLCCVVAFPSGACHSDVKVCETRMAVRFGADEIDMVMNIGAMKSGDYATVFRDIIRVVNAARPATVKVILECDLLTEEEKIIACRISNLAGAAFVKTSTGFSGGGATVDDVHLLRRIVGSEMGVKASGGVRSFDDATRMLEAGANRIGASASVAIVTDRNENTIAIS